MGRYLGVALASKIYITKRKESSYNIKENYDIILKKIGETLDLDIYDAKYEDDVIQLMIKEDFVNDNLKDLILELDKVVPVVDDLKYCVYNDEYNEKTIDDVNIKLYKYDDKYPYEYENQRKQLIDSFYFKINNVDYEYYDVPCRTSTFFFFREYQMINNLEVYAEVNSLWEEQFKFLSETEYYVLHAFNSLKMMGIKNKLKGGIIFTIFG